MDFQLSDEQSLLRDTTRDLLARTYDPESRNKVIGSDLGWSREVWSQLADTGRPLLQVRRLVDVGQPVVACSGSAGFAWSDHRRRGSRLNRHRYQPLR